MKINTDEPFIKNPPQITQKIASFWDKISSAWNKIWGIHIHHGFYEADVTQTPEEAQTLLIKNLADQLQIKPLNQILDAGCGMGGSSFYLSENYQAHVVGITLSKTQFAIAQKMKQQKNIQDVEFKIEDALALTSFPDCYFDVVWSLESCEQFYDKNLFIQQAYRVLKPDGKLMIATWCSDRDEYHDHLAQKYKKLCLAFDLPYMPSINHYCNLLQQNNFSLQKNFDWTDHVIKSWDIGFSLLNTYKFWQLLRMGGWRGLRFAQQLKLLKEAFDQGRVKYGVFIANKK